MYAPNIRSPHDRSPNRITCTNICSIYPELLFFSKCSFERGWKWPQFPCSNYGNLPVWHRRTDLQSLWASLLAALTLLCTHHLITSIKAVINHLPKNPLLANDWNCPLIKSFGLTRGSIAAAEVHEKVRSHHFSRCLPDAALALLDDWQLLFS